MEAGGLTNGWRHRIEQLELWRRDREQARREEKIPERVAVLESEGESRDKAIEKLADEVSSLRKTLIGAAVALTVSLGGFTLTIWAVFG